MWGRTPGPLEVSRLSLRAPQQCPRPGLRGTDPSMPAGLVSEAPRPTATWRGSSTFRPGGPGPPLLRGQESQQFCGLDLQLWVEKPRLQMRRLRLLSAGGPGPTTLSSRAAAGRARAEPRPGDPGLASGKWGSADRVSGAERGQLLAWFQSCGPSRSPGPTQGESRGRINSRSRALRAPRHLLAWRCLPARRARAGLRGFSGPGLGGTCWALVLSDPSSANAARVASQALLAGTNQLRSCPWALLFQEFKGKNVQRCGTGPCSAGNS